MRWNLDALYTSFESENFKSDLEKLFNLVDEMNSWAKDNLNSTNEPVKKMENYILYSKDLKTIYTRLLSFASLSSSVDAKNEKALKLMSKLRVKYSETTYTNVMFKKWLLNVEDVKNIVSSSDILKEHFYFIEEIQREASYMLTENEEMLISKLKNSGSEAWNALQGKLSSTLLVDIDSDGEKKQLPLPIVRNMAYDSDSDVRKNAFYAELDSYKKIDESLAAALNGIKGEVLTICEKRGFESPLHQTLLNSRMDKDTLDAMLEAMNESMPKFRKYFKRKAELLGHKNGLPFYDLFAPMGTAEMSFSYEEARTYIVDNFRSFSDKLADFADNAFKNNWIDAEPRDGKRGGAFCSNLQSINQSRILSNFTGSFSDVSTLAHELGHGYHGYCLNDEEILNTSYPMPLAETASIFCETIIMNAALEKANEAEAFTLLETSISDAAQVIVDIMSRYIFEYNLFETRKDHPLSVNELKDLMTDAQLKTYGDGLDPDALHPYMWACKPHYYSGVLSFYNFPYAFGLLFAKGLYAEYIKRGDEFISNYDELLKATGKNDIADVTMMMGINIREKSFWKASLELVEKDIEKFLEVSQNFIK